MEERDALNRQNAPQENPVDSFPIAERLISRIGLGRYQFLIFIIVAYVAGLDGVEPVIEPVLSSIFAESSWDIPLTQAMEATTFVFLGALVGTLIAAFLAGKYGRKIFFLMGLAFAGVFGLTSAYAPSFWFFIVTRGFYEIGVGLFMTIATIVIVEITPYDQRGQMIVIFNSAAASIGLIIWMALAWLMKISTPGSSEWRLFLTIEALPAILAFFIGICYIKETPRFATIDNLDQGIEVFKHMFKRNNRTELELTTLEMEDLKEWASHPENSVTSSGIVDIFQGKNLRLTGTLSLIWFSASFVMAGLPYILIYGMSQNNQAVDYGLLIFTFCAELPGHAIAYYFIENPKIGRKKLLTFAALSCSILFFFAYGFAGADKVLAFFCRMTSMIAMDTNFTYSAELYHTKYRGNALGFLGGLARSGCVAVPLILVAIMATHGYQVGFFFLGCAALVMGVLAFTIPYETAGKPLDIEYEEEKSFF